MVPYDQLFTFRAFNFDDSCRCRGSLAHFASLQVQLQFRSDRIAPIHICTRICTYTHSVHIITFFLFCRVFFLFLARVRENKSCETSRIDYILTDVIGIAQLKILVRKSRAHPVNVHENNLLAPFPNSIPFSSTNLLLPILNERSCGARTHLSSKKLKK